MVQDGAAAAAIHGEPDCAALSPIERARTGFDQTSRPVLTGLGKGRVRSAGWAATVVLHPVPDPVAVHWSLVARSAEPPPDLGHETVLLSGIASGEAAPERRRDQLREIDRVRVEGSEEPSSAELDGLEADWDERLAAPGPSACGREPVLDRLVPDVPAD